METTTHQSDDDILITGLKSGNQGAFREAVRLYTPGMMAVARFYLDHASAEEIVQDCWVTVIDAVQTFEGRSGLKTWLHRICLLYTSPSPRDATLSRMPSSA